MSFPTDGMNAMVLGYLQCAAWSTSDIPDDPSEGEAHESLEQFDFAMETKDAMRADCEDFVTKNADLCAEAVNRPGYSWSRLGHDFWLTHNGHGAGFWDRDELEHLEPDAIGDSLGDRLTTAAKTYSEVTLYLDRDNDLIYC